MKIGASCECSQPAAGPPCWQQTFPGTFLSLSLTSLFTSTLKWGVRVGRSYLTCCYCLAGVQRSPLSTGWSFWLPDLHLFQGISQLRSGEEDRVILHSVELGRLFPMPSLPSLQGLVLFPCSTAAIPKVFRALYIFWKKKRVGGDFSFPFTLIVMLIQSHLA